MLRISEAEVTGQSVVLCLEGAIRNEWLGELARVSSLHLAAGKSVVLDLSSVSAIDAAAAQFLRSTADASFTIIRASRILSELIEKQGDPDCQA